MPQDWNLLYLAINENIEPINMIWYGENLWYASFSDTIDYDSLSICAEDYSGNTNCLEIK